MKSLQAFPAEKCSVKTRKACATTQKRRLGCQGLFFNAKAISSAGERVPLASIFRRPASLVRVDQVTSIGKKVSTSVDG